MILRIAKFYQKKKKKNSYCQALVLKSAIGVIYGLGRKVMTNLDSILKNRDITLPAKFHLVKAMVFQKSCMDVRIGP